MRKERVRRSMMDHYSGDNIPTILRPLKKVIKKFAQSIDCTYICNRSIAQLNTSKMRRDVFQAIADPTRRAILSLVALNAMTPNAVAAHFDTSRQAVSKHMQILTECQLVEQEQNGREIYYHFNPQKMKEVDLWLEPFRSLWEDKFSRLDNVLNHLKSNKNA